MGNASKALFEQKVKMVYYMDGSYNFGCGDSDGSGWSPYMGSTADCYGAAQYVIANIPSKIKQAFTLNGGDVLTGGRFNDGCGQGPVKEAYQTWTNYGTRPSWDPICVYLSVMGDDSLYSSLQSGTNSVDYYEYGESARCVCGHDESVRLSTAVRPNRGLYGNRSVE